MLLSLLACLATILSTPQQTYEPTSSYQKKTIFGFHLLISKSALKEKADLEPAMALLSLRLAEISKSVPKPALKELQKIPIWIENNDPKVPCMCYHVSKDWLNENGLNPDKEKAVELANIKNFVSWSFDQPLMVLHEMAHGYHDQKFGFESNPILTAYKSAMDKHLYDEVVYFRGIKKKAYAATNQMEYFAELTEALFGYNDFFPFTRPELEKHDPEGFKVVKEAWGV